MVDAIITIFAVAIGYIAGYFARPKAEIPAKPPVKVNEDQKRAQEEEFAAFHTLLNYGEAEAYNLTGGRPN